MNLIQSFFFGIIFILCNFLFLYETLQSLKNYLAFPTARSASTAILTNVGLPILTLCHDSGYSEESLRRFGYDSLQSFTEGKVSNGTLFGWVGTGNESIKKVFEEAYITHDILELLRNDSYLKLNGMDMIPLRWKEKIMVYPEGKCYELDIDQASFSDIALILKFHESSTFLGKIQLIMGDPNRENYRPDILSSTGDKILIDFDKATIKKTKKSLNIGTVIITTFYYFIFIF